MYDRKIARVAHIFTVSLSALLLFLVQPMLAGLLLPRHGGVAGVWAVAMFFFPAVLLAGYAHASVASRKPKVAAAVALASLIFLPIRVPALDGQAHPVWTLLAELMGSIGVPFFVLSSTSPTVQSWFGSYRLYAVSNAASLVALLAYPFAIEPNLARSTQLTAWSVAYAVYVASFVYTSWKAAPASSSGDEADTADWPLWIGLSAIPAALWLAVASQISQSVAPVPLLWILPLATYLLTLILCFEGNWYRPWLFKWLLTPAIAALMFASKQHHWNTSLPLGVGLFLGGLFVCAMICHGELAARKPHAARPVRFYLAMACGGALGTAFVSLLAPAVFSDHTEFHVAVVACVVAGFGLLFVKLTRGNLVRLTVVAAAAFAYAQYEQGGGLRVRNFYGILEVQDKPDVRLLSNGTIIHGVQFHDPSRTRFPTAYYATETAIGQILGKASAPRRVGIVGLGIGTLSAYANEQDTYRFYEINPAVVDIAQKHFLFLRQSKGRTEVVIEDARLAMEREQSQNYDVLVIDAFSGDAVPTHLLTREAFQVYFRHLKPDGVLALHVTGKYVNLAPVAESIAVSLGWQARTIVNSPVPDKQVFAATWVVVQGRTDPRPQAHAWTDDRVALWDVIRR
ncbi:MAG: fused MFS/spermidine synthase [Acidobacteria bacterium]|nr:fused MFS/spermidine synthase [Acidobacteriota bacterium]